VGRQRRQQGAALHIEKGPCTLTKQLTNESKLILGLARTEHSHHRGKAPIGAARPWQGEGSQVAEGRRRGTEGRGWGVGAREAYSG
jgi:hypothetical protein